MKLLLCICFALITCLSSKADTRDNTYFEVLYNMPLTVQSGYGFSDEPLRLAVDQNFTFIWVNGGVRYDINYKTDAFIGIGLGSLLQFQFGYSLDEGYSLIRLRSDLPLSVFSSESGIWHDITIGLYADHAFDFIARDASFGLSIGYNLPFLSPLASSI